MLLFYGREKSNECGFPTRNVALTQAGERTRLGLWHRLIKWSLWLLWAASPAPLLCPSLSSPVQVSLSMQVLDIRAFRCSNSCLALHGNTTAKGLSRKSNLLKSSKCKSCVTEGKLENMKMEMKLHGGSRGALWQRLLSHSSDTQPHSLLTPSAGQGRSSWSRGKSTFEEFP